MKYWKKEWEKEEEKTEFYYETWSNEKYFKKKTDLDGYEIMNHKTKKKRKTKTTKRNDIKMITNK